MFACGNTSPFIVPTSVPEFPPVGSRKSILLSQIPHIQRHELCQAQKEGDAHGAKPRKARSAQTRCSPTVASSPRTTRKKPGKGPRSVCLRLVFSDPSGDIGKEVAEEESWAAPCNKVLREGALPMAGRVEQLRSRVLDHDPPEFAPLVTKLRVQPS